MNKKRSPLAQVDNAVAWEPYAIIAAGAKGGLPEVARKLKELGINPH